MAIVRSISLPAALHDVVQQYAEAMQIPVSQVHRRALSAFEPIRCMLPDLDKPRRWTPSRRSEPTR